MGAFNPQVQVIHVRVRRVVSLARYEPFEAEVEIEALPDPDRKAGENIDLLQQFVLAKVNAQCDAVRASHDKED